ncbi:hypothetical protein Tco_0025361 [Tanacetum coccineum]
MRTLQWSNRYENKNLIDSKSSGFDIFTPAIITSCITSGGWTKRETPKVLSLAWGREFFEIQLLLEKSNLKPEDIQRIACKLLNDVRIISEELAEYINSLSWNRPAFYDDDDDDDKYTNYFETGIDEVINSSVEDLVPIPSESEDIFDDTYDVPFCENSPHIDVFNDHFEIFSDFNDDYTSSDDDYGEDIDYVEASPPDSELVSLEEVKDFDPEDGETDTDILLKIKDDILHEKC